MGSPMVAMEEGIGESCAKIKEILQGRIYRQSISRKPDEAADLVAARTNSRNPPLECAARFLPMTYSGVDLYALITRSQRPARPTPAAARQRGPP